MEAHSGTYTKIICAYEYIFFRQCQLTTVLSKGRSAVAELLGGRLVNPNTTLPDECKLQNVIEEMAIAAGVPVPKIYVLDDENGINAIAADHAPGDAAIGVTRGCMILLNREELQCDFGLGFSHILDGDTRLYLRLMGVVFGILCLAVIGRVLIYLRGGPDRNPLMFLGLALIVIGAIGVFFGRLIQAALGRQQEFLADPSSVQFARIPDGLTSTLKKSVEHAWANRCSVQWRPAVHSTIAYAPLITAGSDNASNPTS